MEMEEPNWMTARRGIKLLLNDKNKEAEDLFNNSPQNIHMTAGVCYVTFLNALMCFDDKKVAEAIVEIKKIEEQCVTQIGWMKSIKNKIFYSEEEDKPLEQILEERIVLADSLVCQSFLTFLRNDFTSYMKGGWTLRKAWKIYQHTFEQLSVLHQKIFGYSVRGISKDEDHSSPAASSPTTMSSSSWSVYDNEQHLNANHITPNKVIKNNHTDNPTHNSTLPFDNKHLQYLKTRNFYSCSSTTISDFSNMSKNYGKTQINEKKGCVNNKYQEDEDIEADEERSKSSSSLSVPQAIIRPNSIHSAFSSDDSINKNHKNSMRKSVSLFSSINSFGSAIYESATSLIGFKKECIDDWENIEPDTVLRLMSAVCFGYGIFRLCVSLAPPFVLRWVNMLGFEGDQSAAIESLHYSRKGTDMRAPMASIALLWYHTIVRPFFNVEGATIESGITEATKILNEEKEYKDSALFLFFKGRLERIKLNIPAAIEAYELSVSNAALTDVKLLGLHEVGWCHLLTLDYQKAHECFLQLRHQSKWSKSFYAYLATINAGACGNIKSVLPGKNEIRILLEKSHNKGAQIEKYIKRRVEKLPDKDLTDSNWVQDKVHWQLYCFEMLYLWNTFSSCSSNDLLSISQTCTPAEGEKTLTHEPMKGIGWLIKGAACVVLANRIKSSSEQINGINNYDNLAAYLAHATEAFRMCLSLRCKCTDDVHISAFAQYELALLLLRDENTRPEGKLLLIKSLSQYKDFDFEHRLNVRINNTLKSVEKYENEQNK